MGSGRFGAGLLLLDVLLSAVACQTESASEPEVQARFGVLFGGQIQERQVFPFVVDQSKQTQLLRIEFASPPTRATEVTWEVDRPRTSLRAGDSVRHTDRVVETGAASIEPGRKRFDQTLPFRPGDPLGRWFIRARVDGRTVLDRGFDVVAADASGER